MLPYLKEGDIVFFRKYKKNKSILKNRQIIIFNHPIKNKNLIKRINLVNHEKIIGIVTSKLIIPKLKNLLIKKNRSTSLNPK